MQPSNVMQPSDLQAYQLIVAVLFGGLAGAVLNQLAAFIVYQWKKPKLEAVFSEAASGCVADTPLHVITGKRIGDQRYLRVCIRNQGRTAAHGVNVCSTEIQFYPKSGPAVTFSREVLDLKLALSSEVIFNVGAGGHRFVDLFSVSETSATKAVSFEFGFAKTPFSIMLLGLGNGSYSALVFVTADNAASVKARISWHWEGSLTGLHIPSATVQR
jgi:hypothetical protein